MLDKLVMQCKKYNIHWNLLIIGFGFIINYSLLMTSLEKAFLKDSLIQVGKFISFIAIGGIGFLWSKNLNIKTLIEFVSSVVGVVFLLYQILETMYLNDSKFDIRDAIRNYFVTVDPVLILVLVLLTAVMFYYWLHHYSKNKYYIPQINYTLNHAILTSFVVFNHPLLIEVLSEIDDLNTIDFMYLYGLAIFVIYYLIKGIKDLISNYISKAVVFSCSLLFAILFNGTIQYGLKQEELLLDKAVFPGATLYQIFVLFSAFFLLYIIINRFLMATILNIVIGIAISSINFMKQSMRNEPFLITDLVWVTEIKLLISFLTTEILIFTTVIILILTVVYFLLHKRFLVGKIIKNIPERVILLLMPICFFVGISAVFSSETNSKIPEGIPVLSKLNNESNITWLGFSKNASYKSLMYVWTKQLTKRIMEKPQGYSRGKMNEIAQKYEDLAETMNKERMESISDQTVIYILSESFSDPTKLPQITLSEDPIPNIRQIQNNTTSGQMHSDHYGGGTANMEIQALTSLPYYNFSQSVSVINLEISPILNYMPAISNYFESDNRFVLHPLNAENYQRDKIYTGLNFEHLVFQTGSDEKFQNEEFVGNNVSDRTVYNNILNRLDVSKSQFFSVITMQGHLPWGMIDSNLKVSGTGFTAKQNNDLQAYSRLLKITDEETKAFLKSLEGIDKKITVVFYGDHLPGLYPSSVFTDDKESQFKTEYFIWSNFKTLKLDYPLINSSDFTALLLKQTNSKVSPFYALQTEVLEKASVNNTDNRDEDGKQVSQDLKMVQYDLSLGKGYIVDKNFFDIPK